MEKVKWKYANMTSLNYSLTEFAQKYYKLGWNVIPLFDYSKNPATGAKLLPNGGWDELKNRKVTEEEFNRFFIENKPTGVGVICGSISGIVVVDEDSYKANGMAFDLDSPIKSRTANKGTHYFFKYQDEVKTSGFRQGVNIEIKSNGGFVVLPPSEVKNKEGQIAKYEWLEASGKIENLPTISEGQLLKYKKSSSDYTSLHELVNAEIGERHNNLRTIALKVFARFKKEEWDIAAEFIRQEARKFKPPHDSKDVERIIKDCANFISSHSKEEVQESINRNITIKIYSSTEAEAQFEIKRKQYGEGITTGFKKLDEYFRFIPEQLYMLSAQTHIGKTTLALNMAANIAEKGHKVLFASLEQGLQIVPRVKSILGVERIPETFSILDTDEFPSADDFITVINELSEKPDVLFLDHLHYFARGVKKSNEEIDRIIVEIQAMAKKLQIPILVISHVRKINDNKAPTMDDMKDSVSLSQIPSVVMILHRDALDPDLQFAGSGLYDKNGFLFINKNRIQGKTGSEKIYMEDTGEVTFPY